MTRLRQRWKETSEGKRRLVLLGGEPGMGKTRLVHPAGPGPARTERYRLAKPRVLLLRHVLRSLEPMRLLMAATYRDTDLGRANPLAEFLADGPPHD